MPSSCVPNFRRRIWTVLFYQLHQRKHDCEFIISWLIFTRLVGKKPIFQLWRSEVKISQLCPTLCNPVDYTVHEILQARILEWVAFPLCRGIFPTQGSNPGHCRWILYQLSRQGSPGILEWVAYSFSSGTSQPRNRTGVSCIAGGFFTSWATREAHLWLMNYEGIDLI